MASIVITALAVPAFAAEAWGPITRVNDDGTTTSQVAPDIAVGPSGAAIAVWQDYRASPAASPFSQIDVVSSRWDPGSGVWAATTRINDVTTGQQYKASVAVDGSDNAYAVWVDRRSGRSDIYASKRAASTGTWNANVRVNSTTKFDTQDYPAIAVTASGDAIALWYREANHKSNIWAARLPAGGSTWGPEIRVTSNQTTQKQGPRVSVGPNGTAYAVWMDPAVGNADIWYSTLAAGSSTWSTNTKISDDPGSALPGADRHRGGWRRERLRRVDRPSYPRHTSSGSGDSRAGDRGLRAWSLPRMAAMRLRSLSGRMAERSWCGTTGTRHAVPEGVGRGLRRGFVVGAGADRRE
jgi:hypothetical protein